MEEGEEVAGATSSSDDRKVTENIESRYNETRIPNGEGEINCTTSHQHKTTAEAVIPPTSATKKKKKKKKKNQDVVDGSDDPKTQASASINQLKTIQKMIIDTAKSSGGVTGADKKYVFWETQPVPKLGKKHIRSLVVCGIDF